MTRKVFILFLALAISFQFTELVANPAVTKWTGMLVDKKCFDHCAKKSDMSMLVGHERSCVMICAKNGKSLGLLMGRDYIGFDHNGEKLAWKILIHSKSEETVRVTVTGTLVDGVIHVQTIKPANLKPAAAE